MVELYETIFKRKSFHLFRGVGSDSLTLEELTEPVSYRDGKMYFTANGEELDITADVTTEKAYTIPIFVIEFQSADGMAVPIEHHRHKDLDINIAP